MSPRQLAAVVAPRPDAFDRAAASSIGADPVLLWKGRRIFRCSPMGRALSRGDVFEVERLEREAETALAFQRAHDLRYARAVLAARAATHGRSFR